MALPDTCPKCGERATNDQGRCVFCGTQVIHPSTILTPQETDKAKANYRFASWSFTIVGIIYLIIGIVSSIAYRQPMLGLIISGLVAGGHGALLLMNNEWAQSVAKPVCIGRLILLFWFVAILIPYLLFFRIAGMVLLAFVMYDILSLILMIRTIDSVN